MLQYMDSFASPLALSGNTLVGGLFTAGGPGTFSVNNSMPAGFPSSSSGYGITVGTNGGLRDEDMLFSFGNLSTIICGLRAYQTALSSSMPLFGIGDNTSGNHNALNVTILPSGKMQVTTAAGGTYTSSNVVSNAGSWHYYELVCTPSTTTTGSFYLYVDNVLVLSATGIAIATVNSFCNMFIWWALPGITNYIMDFYVADNTTSYWNAPVGDTSIVYRAVTGNGANDQFTPNPGTNANWQNVTTNDGDTTYNSATTAGYEDRYTFGALPGAATGVNGVLYRVSARKDDVAARTLQFGWGSGSGSAYAGSPPTMTLTSSYAGFIAPLSYNPLTSAAFTVSDVNSGQTAIKAP